MESHQRAAIEDLKQQKAKYELLLAELQAQKGCAPAVHAQQQQQAAKLQQLAITYSRKVSLDSTRPLDACYALLAGCS
jgi:hypothetical protein